MNGIVYLLDAHIGVGHFTDGQTTWVGEVNATGGQIKVLPHSLRAVTEIVEADVDVADDPSAQDHCDRLVHRIDRLVSRLPEFPRGQIGEMDTGVLRAKVRELEARMAALLDVLVAS